MTEVRGRVIALTAAQRRDRMLYLAGERALSDIAGVDLTVPPPTGYPVLSLEVDKRPIMCPAIYYRLNDYNGGKDPTARDCATRWRAPDSTTWNRTSDCIGGMSWAGGWDRYQPVRFQHIYGGWINTDSMRQDAAGPRRCFVRRDRPEPGCYVVFASGAGGHKVGHIGGVVDVPAEYAPSEREWWVALGVVDVAGREGRANLRTTGLTWFRKDAWFIVPVMLP